MKITGRNKSILLETAMRLGTVTAATVMTEVYRRSPGPAEMSPVLARSRTSLLLHPQELGFVVSALWQRSLAWCAKIPARQGSPGKTGEREREKEELGLLSFPCLWKAGECQGSRAGAGIVLCPTGGGQRNHSPDRAVVPGFAPHHCLPLTCRL